MSSNRLGVGLGLALLCVAGPARAIESTCTTDADCGWGLGCFEGSYVECSGTAGGAGGQAGAPGEDGCTTVFYRACLPVACTSNADCTGGTSCVAFTYETCSGGGSTPGTGTGGEAGGGAPDSGGRGGEPGTGGDVGGGDASGGAGGSAGGEPPVPEDCETVTESWCVPPWLAPCDFDADCGPGFLCVADELCTSTPDEAGGAGGAAGGAGGSPCVPSEVKHCELIPTACGSSADCGPGLVCEDFTEWVCGGDEEEPPPPPGGEGGAGGEPDPGGRGGEPNGGGAGGGDTGTGGASGGTGGAPGPDCWTDANSLCVPPGFVEWMFAYGPTRGGDQAGYGGNGGLEGAGGASAPADDDRADGSGADGSASGCQTGGGGLSLLALLGVALALRRR